VFSASTISHEPYVLRQTLADDGIEAKETANITVDCSNNDDHTVKSILIITDIKNIKNETNKTKIKLELYEKCLK